MSIPRSDLQLIQMLSRRLERISADSVWAHRASGVRGSLLRILDEGEKGHPSDPRTVSLVISTAMNILAQAAQRK